MTTATITCNRCGEAKPDDETGFPWNRSGPRAGTRSGLICLACKADYAALRYHDGDTERASKRRGYRCGTAKTARQHRQELKRKVIDAYGGACLCCGETNLGFLTVDHGNDDGAEHRRSTGYSSVYAWINANGYPQDIGLRCLCFNCNLGRAANGGVCPHEDES